MNIEQAVPLFAVSSMDASLRFYVDGLGFVMKSQWIDDGKLRWCWLQLDGVAVMIQEIKREGPDSWTPAGKLGEGVSICFICRDAIAFYHDVKSRGIDAATPFVGNGMWVTSLRDPDGYRLEFESLTDAPEDTVYSAQGEREG